MPSTTITSKGQITIPKQIRQRLGLKTGSRLQFRIDEEGKLVVQPEMPGRLGRVPGLLHHLAGKRPLSVEEMEAAIRRKHESAAGATKNR